MHKNHETFLIIGWGRSGKDECAQFAHSHLGLRYGGSTSWAALPFMAERLGVHPMQAWEERHKHRQLWKDTCDELRAKDPCFFIRRALFQPFNDRGPVNIITGIRGAPELDRAIEEKLFNHIIWIDRAGNERDTTVDFGMEKANHVIYNDGTLRNFHRKILALFMGITSCSLSEYAQRLAKERLDP